MKGSHCWIQWNSSLQGVGGKRAGENMEEHRSFGEMRAEVGFGKSMPWMMKSLTLQSFSGIYRCLQITI